MVLDADLDRRRLRERPLGGVGHRAARPRRRRRVHRAVRRARARRRTAPPSSAAASPAGTSPTTSSSRSTKRGSVGRAHAGLRAAHRRSRRRRPTSAPTTSGCSRCAPSSWAHDDWVRTTDLARVDADGFLWILGRADQTIIRGGLQGAARGRARRARARPGGGRGRGGGRRRRAPRRGAGGRGRAAAGRRASTKPPCSRSRAAHLARYEVPVSVTVVDALPRTASGKVDLAAVRELVGARVRRRADDRGGEVGVRRAAAAHGRGAGAACCATSPTPSSRSSSRHPSWKRWCRPCATRSGSWRAGAGRSAPRVGDDPSPERPRSYVDHGYATSATTTRASRAYELDGGRRRCARHRGVPRQLRGPARDRARRVPRGVLRLRAAAAQLRRSASRARPPSCRSGTGGRRRLLSPLTYRAERVVDGSRITAHCRALPRRRAALRSAPSASRRRATSPRSPRSSGHDEHDRTDHGQPGYCARASRSAPTLPSSCATTTGSPTPTPNGGAGSSLAGCSLPGRGAAAASVCSSRPASTSSLAWLAAGAHRRHRRPDQHVLHVARAARPVGAAPTSTSCIGIGAVPGQRLRRRARRRRRPRRRRRALPRSHRTSAGVWLDGFADVGRRSPPPYPTRCSTRSRTTSPPDDRMVIVHTSGSTERAEGRDPPARPARSATSTTSTASAASTPGRACSRTRRSSGSAASPTTSSACSWPAPRSCARAATDPVDDARPHRARAARAHQRLRGVDRAPGRAPVVRRAATSRRSVAATSSRSCPTAIRARRPRAAPQHARHDRDRQRVPHERRRDRPARAPARFVRAPVPGLRRAVVDPETLERRRRSAAIGELWFRGPSLMEGYYGRERAEVFTPDGWYRTGDLFHVDADGFFYFHGRRGDMIKTAGANVSPREVEAAIARRHRRSRRDGARRPRSRTRPGGRRGRSCAEPDDRARPRRAAHRAARAALGVQGAAALPRARRRRGADAVERQARRTALEERFDER